MKFIVNLFFILSATACTKLQSGTMKKAVELPRANSTPTATTESSAPVSAPAEIPIAVVAEAAAPAPVSGDTDPEACTSYSKSDQDGKALAEIAQLNQVQCKLSFQLLSDFYRATKDMTDPERRDYFQRQIAGLNPPPPPPPAPCSVIFYALLKCAKGI